MQDGSHKWNNISNTHAHVELHKTQEIFISRFTKNTTRIKFCALSAKVGVGYFMFLARHGGWKSKRNISPVIIFFLFLCKKVGKKMSIWNKQGEFHVEETLSDIVWFVVGDYIAWFSIRYSLLFQIPCLIYGSHFVFVVLHMDSILQLFLWVCVYGFC